MPNYMSVVWILICIKLALYNTHTSLFFIDYIILLISLAYFVVENRGLKFIWGRLFVFKDFIILAFIQTMGIFWMSSLYSVRNVISTLSIALFLYNAMFYRKRIQMCYIRTAYYFTVFYTLYTSMNGILLDNTISGGIAFALFGYIFMEIQNNNRKFLKEWCIVIIVATISVYAIFTAGARAALIMVFAAGTAFIFLSIFRLSIMGCRKLFWITSIITVMGTIFYIHINDFSWIEMFNEYSLQYFDKNLNSSRPYLWKYSLDSLESWQIIIGKGTGFLPEIERYSGSSFHNSYIQLIMQNGMVGMVVLFIILKKIWYLLSVAIDNIHGRLLIAFNIGVIAYNCFECTLIQNKVFIGYIQWLFLGLGIRYAKHYMSERINI